MATRGISLTIHYVAWNTSTNSGQAGDAGNHTLVWAKDNTAVTPTNSPAEIDAVNAPGLYKLTLTSTETDADIGTLGGVSSTANVSIMPITIQFERLPNAAPGASGGVPVLDANLEIAASTLRTNNDKADYSLAADQSTVTIGTTNALGTQAKADVNAEVVDVLQTDTPVANVSIVEALRRIGALTSGVVSGAGSGTETFQDYAGSANTIVITVDASGNRTSITYN